MTLEELGMLLNKELVRALYSKVVEAQNEPYLTFLLSWIILNHFYTTYCDHERLPAGQSGDRKELLHFARHPEVVAARTTVLDRKAGAAEVQLPVTKRTRAGRERLVPHLGERSVRANEFTCEEHFEVIYAIRNNVMHGDKAPLSPTDRKNISFAAVQTRDLVKRLATIGHVPLR